MQAYILITTDAGKVMDVLSEIRTIEGVKSAHATIGSLNSTNAIIS